MASVAEALYNAVVASLGSYKFALLDTNCRAVNRCCCHFIRRGDAIEGATSFSNMNAHRAVSGRSASTSMLDRTGWYNGIDGLNEHWQLLLRGIISRTDG